MLWLAAVTAIAAGCQMLGFEPPGQPESQPTETPASKPIEQPDEQSEQSDGLPALVIADVSAGEGDALLRFPVSLSATAAEPVTVAYATEDGTATAGADYTAVSGTLTFAVASTEARRIEVPVRADAVAEETETFTMRLSDPQGATLAAATATATIVDDDRRSVVTYPAELHVEEGAAGSYAVVLGTQPTAPVTVTVTVAETAELSIAPDEVVFTAAAWRQGRTVTVTAAEDEDALADAPVELRHAARGGGYDGLAAAVEVTIVENDVQTLAAAAARAAEGAGRLRFAVSLSVASDNAVTVDWGTGAAGDTAIAGADYTAASGELSFPAGSREARTIEVVVRDDPLDEPDEEFTVTLSNPVHAELAGGGETATATGTIEDDDEAPELSIADAGGIENDGAMEFTVRLDQASGRSVMVNYATVDVTAAAGADYTGVSDVLTFAAGTRARTIAVPILNDGEAEEEETFTVTLNAAVNAVLDADGHTATGTIVDNDDAQPRELASLEVAGGLTGMYPAFDPGTYHYALTCSSSATLDVTARARGDTAQLTLRRADTSRNVVATGTLTSSLTDIEVDHDIVIELGDTEDVTTYVVHCLPADLPEMHVLKKTASVSDGLLFVTPSAQYLTIIDKNGVPRFHREEANIHLFQAHPDGPVIDGRQVRYSYMKKDERSVRLLDEEFEQIRTVQVVHPLTEGDPHDYVMIRGATDADTTFLLVSYRPAIRDGTEYEDSVIQEVSLDGTELFRWNSWDHVKRDPDCTRRRSDGDYAHLNSLYLFEDDIIASLPGCAQVVRIDRASGTGQLQWKIGGTAPTRHPHTEYLEIVGDTWGEFCGQHQASMPASGRLLMFDNGNLCQGHRKDESPFARIVEWDISSGTQADFRREYERDGYHTRHTGGVTELSNGHWLIAWGGTPNVRDSDAVSISEVDPATGTAHLEILMLKSGGGYASSYRVYHASEADVSIPPNLP